MDVNGYQDFLILTPVLVLQVSTGGRRIFGCSICKAQEFSADHPFTFAIPENSQVCLQIVW